jgi:hypothetical protein
VPHLPRADDADPLEPHDGASQPPGINASAPKALKPGTTVARPMAEPEPEATKKFEGPVSVERSFKIDGKKLTVLVTFPAAVVQEVGMEALVLAANRAIVTIESKNHAVDKFR